MIPKNGNRFSDKIMLHSKLSRETSMIRMLAVVAALACAAPAFAQQPAAPAAKPAARPAGTDPQNTILIDTSKGRIVVKLRPDLAPKHAERIKLLAREQYYDNVPFHRVIPGFMAQTGDGQNQNGTGGSKYPELKAEFTNTPFKRGVLGMARAQSNDSANSQFFIMFAEGSFLNGKYTVIGEVVTGMDVVDKLNQGEPPANPDKMVKVQVAADAK
jgi:peptidylprolyl isomerase